MKDGLSAWIPVTHVGDSVGDSGSGIQRGPDQHLAVCSCLESEPVADTPCPASPLVSVALPFKQTIFKVIKVTYILIPFAHTFF